MAYQYVARHPFGPYLTGDHITDPDEMVKWQQSHPEFMIRKWVDETESVPRVPPPATPAEQPAPVMSTDVPPPTAAAVPAAPPETTP